MGLIPNTYRGQSVESRNSKTKTRYSPKSVAPTPWGTGARAPLLQMAGHGHRE